MTHILENSHSELERTHDTLVNFKYSNITGFLYDVFGAGFKKNLIAYAYKKEDILLEYSSLYSDLQKDIEESRATPTDMPIIQEKLLQITRQITDCGNILSKLIAHTQRQEEILEHEKIFFAELLKCFNQDLLSWTRKYETDILGEKTHQSGQAHANPMQESLTILKKQKERLEKHIESIKITESSNSSDIY